MLFTCAPRAAAATRPASRKIVKRGNRSFAVDLHCYVHTPAADELAKKSERPAVDPLARYRNPRTQEHQQKLRAQLEHLVRLWDAGRVVIGTDYPYDMGYYKPVEFVNAVKSLTRAQKAAIIGGNAARLLKIKRRAGARKSGRA